MILDFCTWTVVKGLETDQLSVQCPLLNTPLQCKQLCGATDRREHPPNVIMMKNNHVSKGLSPTFGFQDRSQRAQTG